MPRPHTHAPSLEAYLQDVDHLLRMHHGLTALDAAVDTSVVRAWCEERTPPSRFVAWWAEKHGLAHVDELRNPYALGVSRRARAPARRGAG